MSLSILRPGLLTTVQDGGRYGRQKIGVIPSGAMDLYSLRMANLLVGNDEYAAALEITLTGPVIECTADTLIAVAGGDFRPVIGDEPVPLFRPVAVRAGTVLRFGPCRTGCRAYVAAAGGIDVPAVMGSRSTCLPAGFGGCEGRALRKGDLLPTGAPGEYGRKMMHRLLPGGARPFGAAKWRIGRTHVTAESLRKPLRVTAGLQYDAFTDRARHDFFHTAYRVAVRSDRMGCRLSGTPLPLRAPLEMISEASPFGTVQIPPDGQPIILMADHQTTAGYPVIAQVSLVDAARAAQLRPGDTLRFRLISRDEAEELCIAMERCMENIKIAVAGML